MLNPNTATLNPHRLNQNPLEQKFIDAWRALNHVDLDDYKLLEYILNNKNNETEPVSDRDKQVAETIIQWLGSPVGQGMIATVMNKKT